MNHRRVRAAIAFAVAALAGLAAANPAAAQERHRVLVPNFEPRTEVRGNFGRDIAQQVQRAIQSMPRHQTVDSRHLRDQLRTFQIREEDLTCTTGIQLSVRTGYELVLCGEFEPAAQGGMNVTARVVVPETQDAFDIPEFHAANPRDGAAHIVQAFEKYTQMLTVAVICQEYLDSQQWEEALPQCDRALAISDRAQSPLYGRAYALMKLDRDEDALATFERLLEVAPGHMEATLSAGIVATRLGQSDKAMQHFRNYLEMNPGEVSVRLAVANDVFQAGDPVAALAIVEEGMTGENATDVDMMQYAGHLAVASAQQLAIGAVNNGPDPEARALYEKAIGFFDRVYAAQGAETEVSTLQQMMAAYVALGQNERAVEFGARVTQSHNDAQLWFNYARALHAAGQVAQAVSALERVGQIDPELRGVAGMRGSWMLAEGNVSGARTAFQQAVQRGEVESDAIARQLAGLGFNNHGRAERHGPAIEYYTVAREFAQGAQPRAMVNFFHGYALLKQAEARSAPMNAAAARAALPMFQQALEMLRNAEAFTDQATTRTQLIGQAQQFIETMEALIRRGG